MARTRKGESGAGEDAPATAVTESAGAPGADTAAAPQEEPGRSDAAAEAPPEPEPVTLDEPEVVLDPAPAIPPEPAAAPPAYRGRRRIGGFLGMVLGGAVAAAVGVGAAVYVLPRVWTPPLPTEDIDALRGALAQQSARLDTLSQSFAAAADDTALADLATAQAALGEKSAAEIAALADGLAAIEVRLSEAAARLEGLDGRIATLEKRPVEGGAASATALEAFGRDMQAFRSELAAQKSALAAAQGAVAAEARKATDSIAAAAAAAERLRAETAQTTRDATVSAALGRIEAALTAGGALAPALADLGAAGVEVPPALAEQSQGVPTLEALRAAFPPAARGALSVSLKETAEGSAWNRLFAFLRTQTGARSLSPREGADPDAVLSRAEAALAAGDPGAAIAEIGALPAEGRARMAEWVTLAERRIAATEAAAALAATVK